MAINWFSNAIEADEPLTAFELQPNKREFLSITSAFHYFMDQIYDGAGIGSWGIAELNDGTFEPLTESKAADREDLKQFITFDFQWNGSTNFYDEKGNIIFNLPEGK